MKTSTKTMRVIREKAFRSFSVGLRKTPKLRLLLPIWLSQVLKNWLQICGGYDSVFDYLSWAGSRSLTIFDHRWPWSWKDCSGRSKFLKHVAKVNGLEKMTFADWKLDLDSALNPDVTSGDDAYGLVANLWHLLGRRILHLSSSLPNQQLGRFRSQWWDLGWFMPWPIPCPPLCPAELDRTDERCLPWSRSADTSWSNSSSQTTTKATSTPTCRPTSQDSFYLLTSSSRWPWNLLRRSSSKAAL